MKIAALVLLCTIALPLAAQLPQGVAAGDVTPHSAVLWAHSATTGDVHFILIERGAWPPVVHTAKVSVADAAIPAKASFDGLRAGQRYNYLVVAPHGDRATGTFVTPAAKGQNGLHFGISGDWRGELAPYVGISNAADRDLDFWVSL